MKTTHSFLTATMGMFASSAISLAVVFVAQADEAAITNLDGGAASITISGDSTLTVPNQGYGYTSLTVSGSGKLTLAGTGRITTSSVTVSSGVELSVNGRLDSTSITVASGGAVDLVNSRDAHSLSIAGTGINNSGAAYCSESDITDENNSPFVTNITLTADATVKADYAWGIIAQDSDTAYLDLGTNKLTIKGTNNFLIAKTEVYGSGAIEVAGGATLKPIKASPNSIFEAPCTIKSGGKLDVAMTATFKDLVCEEGGSISVSSGKNLCIRNQGTMTVSGTANVRGNLYIGTQYTHTANLEVGGVVNVHDGGKLGVGGSGYIKRIPGTQGKVNIEDSGCVEYEYCANPWIAEYGDVFAGTGELTFETEGQITHTITNSTFSGTVKFAISDYPTSVNNVYHILGGSEGPMFSGTPEFVSGGRIYLGSWYDVEGRSFGVKNLSGNGSFNAYRATTETPWTNTLETTQTKDTLFSGAFTGDTCAFGLNVKGADELHALTLSGASTTRGTLSIADKARVVFTSTGSWANGMVSVASGAYLEVTNAAQVASALQLQSGSTLKIATKVENGVTNAIPLAVGALVLPQEGNATIDVTDMPELAVGESQTLIACAAVTSATEVSHLGLNGNNEDYELKAVAGTGIVVEHVQEALVWSKGSWKVNSPEDMQRFSKATIVLAEGENVVELPVDVSFETVIVSAAAAATACFSNHAATVGQLVLGENVTFVNNGLLNSAPVSVATNAVFEIALPMTWSHAISGEGGVMVSADEVVFAAQSTFTGGLTVAPGGRARTTVSATKGGGYGGTKASNERFTGNVAVESGGTVNMVHTHYNSCYSLILAGTGIEGSGAAFRSGGISDPENQPHAMSITLMDDATVSANNSWGLVAPSYGATTLNLSNHKLTVTGTSNFLLCNTTINGTGTIEIADGATLKTFKNQTAGLSATCRIKSGGKLFVNRATTFSNVICEGGSTIKFANSRALEAAGSFQLPTEGKVTIDISDINELNPNTSRTIVYCSAIDAGTDISHLNLTGKINYSLKAVSGGIAVEHKVGLVWQNGNWNVGTLAEEYDEADIILSAGNNTVTLPWNISFGKVDVFADEAATVAFSENVATAKELYLCENVTFVNNDKLAAAAILMSTNSVFKVAQSTEYSGAISGEGTVTVADGAYLDVTNTTSVAAALQLQPGSTLKIAVNVENDVTNAIPVAVGSLPLPDEGKATIDISDVPDLETGVPQMLIVCPSVAADIDLSHLAVTGKTGCRLKAVEGTGIAVELLPAALTWSDGSWNVAPEDMQRYSEASVVLSAGTNTVTVPGEIAFDRIFVTAAEDATLFMTGAVATVSRLTLNTNVTLVAPHDWDVDTIVVDSGASISSESDDGVADTLVLVHGTTVYRGEHVVRATNLAVVTNATDYAASAPKSAKMLLGSGKPNGVTIRNTTGQNPSGNFEVLHGRWSVRSYRPNPESLILEPEAEPGSGEMTITEEGASFARASWTAPSGEVYSYESGQDAADAAKDKGGKVTVHASGESISLGSGWFSSGASIIVPAGVVGVTVTVAGVVIGGKDSGDDSGSRKYDEGEPERAEVVETGVKYSSLSLAKSTMGNASCTFKLLAESADSIHLASVSDESGQTLLLNNFPYAGTVTGAAASLAQGESVTAYYAILDNAKSAWTEGDTINLLTDETRYAVGSGKTLVLDGERKYAVAKPFDLNGTLKVGGCTFTASSGIYLNGGTLEAAKADCMLIDSGNDVTLGQGGVRVDTAGYNATIAAAISVTGPNMPVIAKTGRCDLTLSGGVTGGSAIISVPDTNSAKVKVTAASECEPGDLTMISEQDATWKIFEYGIAVANVVSATGKKTAYGSMSAVMIAIQTNPTYQYIEVLVNNQSMKCLPTIGVIRVKYDNTVFTFSVTSLAQDWQFHEVYAVEFSTFTPEHKATDYVWNGGQNGEWDSMLNWKYNVALDYDLPIATRTPEAIDTVTFRKDGMPEGGWSAVVGGSGAECKSMTVDENASLTLAYSSIGCDITKKGLGTITVTNAWASGTPTITVVENGGIVTIPKSASYMLGTNTVVESSSDTTITLGYAEPKVGSAYDAWAEANGVAGAWDDKGENGIYNVFLYAFNKPTGDFSDKPLIDISFDNDGNVIVKTPIVVNRFGFTYSIIASDDVVGAENTKTYHLSTFGETKIDKTTSGARFFRLEATVQ